jgi:hypothetical protein
MRRDVTVVAERQEMSPEILGDVLGLRSKPRLYLAGIFGFTDKSSTAKILVSLAIILCHDW